MNEMSAMPSAVAQWLGEREEFTHIKFLTEFPPVKKAVPLKKITVAVGIGDIKIEDNFAGGEMPEGEEYCRSAVIDLRFYIHAPYRMGGVACHETFADITDCLTFDSGLEIKESGCGSISEDRNTEAFVLAAYAKVASSICPPQSTDMVFPSFLDKTLFCGSHIGNEAIHQSESQQEYLNEPYKSGSYYGTGTKSRSFSVGFQPSAVFVMAGDLPSAVKDGTYIKIYAARAVREGGSAGVAVTSSGFIVNQGTTYAIAGSYPALNESGVLYTYVVFR